MNRQSAAHRSHRRKYLFAAALGLLICACSVLRPSPAKDTGFIPNADQLTENRERAPFNGFWESDRFDDVGERQRYSGIYIRPVETMVVENQIDALDMPEGYKTQRKEEAREVARYTREKFQHTLREYPGQPLTVLDDPLPGSLVLQMAIVELTPTNPVINTIGTAASFFVPGAEIVKVFSIGSVASEVFVRELDSSQMVLAWKDRQREQYAPINIKDYQEYAHIRAAIDAWAEETAELISTGSDHKVEARSLITLLPF